MKSIRVLIANRPRLIRELVMATISDQPDIEIAVDRTQPDFLIVALEKSNRVPEICQSILQNHPLLKVIAISPDRNNSMYYWASLRIQSNQIEASEEGVLGALRGKAQPTERLQ